MSVHLHKNHIVFTIKKSNMSALNGTCILLDVDRTVRNIYILTKLFTTNTEKL